MADNRRLTRREVDRILRLRHGSKAELALRAKVPRAWVYHWLQGRMNSHVIESHANEFALHLAASLGLSHDEIYFDQGQRPLKRRRPVKCRLKRMSLVA